METETREKNVNTPIPAYERMAAGWDLIHDLLGGTAAMRAAREKWLPQEPAEKVAAYEVRLGRSILYDALKDTINKLSSKPFSRPLTVEDVPAALEYVEDDVDGNGQSATQLGKELFDDLSTYGKCHVLVDFSRVPENEVGRASIADERKVGARAFLQRVAPPDLVGWRSTPKPGGGSRLDVVRIREIHEEDDGEWGVREVKHVRVVTRDSWQLWRRSPDSEGRETWAVVEEGSHTFGEVPFFTAYSNRTGFLVSEPPLSGLAWLNLAHWQSQSDQRNILRFSRMGLLFRKGVSKAEAEQKIAIGPSSVVTSTNENADMKYVEHSGKAIGAGEADLESLERKMAHLGMQPLVQKAQVTATEKVLDEGRNLTQIQAWIRALERLLRDCYKAAARWHGISEDLIDEMTLDVYSDFTAGVESDKDSELLRKLAEGNKITVRTLLSELRRRGILSDSVDPEEEAAAAAKERDAIGGLPEGDPGDAPVDPAEGDPMPGDEGVGADVLPGPGSRASAGA